MNDQTLTLIDILAKGTAVLLFSFGGITCMHRCSAAQRSLAWLAGFGALLMLPLAGFVQPIWPVPVTTVKALRPLENVAPLPAVPTSSLSDTSSAFTPAMAVSQTWNTWQWLGAIYITGAISILAFRLLGSSQLRRLKHETTTPDASIQSLVRELRKKYRIQRRIEVYLSDRITVPMTWGTLKPVLLLPSDCTEWSDADLHAALEHELAHIRHLDAARRWLTTLVSALWWPHPLVWIARKVWQLEQERACDDAVLCSGADVGLYAEQLLHAASTLRLGSFQSAAALVMAMPSGLETRLCSVMGTDVNRSTTGRAASVITLIAGLLVVTICTVCQAQTEVPVKAAFRAIHITTKFVEFATEDLGTKHPALKKALEGTPVILSDTEMQELWRQLSQKKGVHLMSAPNVVTRTGQRARVEVVREFIYPIAFEKDSDTPTAFDMTPLGVIADVQASFEKNGNIRMEPVEGCVNELLGYMSGGRLHRLPKDEGSSGVGGLPRELSDKIADLKLPTDGRESQPIFSTRKWVGNVSLQNGQWIVCYLKHTDDRDKDNRGVWFFVSAKEYVEDVKKSKTAPATPPVDHRLNVK